MEQEIECPRGCPPDRVDIGKDGKTLKWIFTPQGAGPVGVITQVSGLPSPPFFNPRPENGAYLWDYNGWPDSEKDWGYSLESAPQCPGTPEDTASQPQLTTGPG